MSRGTNLRFTVFLLAVLSGFPVTLAALESAKPLPEVTEHAAVKYQPLALQARISGQVHLQITTDGHGVIDVTVQGGHPLLAQAAVENVGTWKFVDHVPGTFDITFNFHFLDDEVTFLKQPGMIEAFAFPEGGGMLTFEMLKERSIRVLCCGPITRFNQNWTATQ